MRNKIPGIEEVMNIPKDAVNKRVEDLYEEQKKQQKTYDKSPIGNFPKSHSSSAKKSIQAVPHGQPQTLDDMEDYRDECESEGAILFAEEAPSPNTCNSFTVSAGFPSEESGYVSGDSYNKKKMVRDRPIMADTMMGSPALSEDVDLFKQHVIIEKINERLHVTVIAIDKAKPEANAIVHIKANGDPLGGQAYDAPGDCYLVSCISHVSLGTIPLVLRLSVPGHNSKQIVPLPEALVHKYMSPNQRRLMRLFAENHSNCEIQFIQSLSRT
jgi:hypothetical protein